MIAIKDFKMPRGCYECPFADESIRMDCDYYCQAAKEKPDVQYGLNKPDWCPLVDVPDEVGKGTVLLISETKKVNDDTD